MKLPVPNNNKQLYLDVDGCKVARYPIRTQLLVKGDDVVTIVQEAVDQYLTSIPEKNAAIVVGEKAVSASQGRAVLITDIKPSRLAYFLTKFVRKSKVGIGLGMPETMEMAIREVGVPRMFLGFLAAAVTKPFGIRGMFYRVTGDGARSIDGPTPYTIPPYNKSAVLGPKNPNGVAKEISIALHGLGVVIIDANDIGQNVLGSASLSKEQIEFVRKSFADNPLGQSTEQTPVAIVAWN